MPGERGNAVERRDEMASKAKEVRLEQRSYVETKLNERLSALRVRGMDPRMIARDSAVRMLRAQLREADQRLRAIEEKEKKVEEMARRKAEKAAESKRDKRSRKKTAEDQDEAAMSKRQMKKLDKQKEKQKKKEVQEG